MAIPTAYTLDEKQVEALIDAAHKILDANSEFRRLLTDLALSPHRDRNEDDLQKVQ